MPQVSPLESHEGTLIANRADAEMGNADLETTPLPVVLQEAWAQTRGRDPRLSIVGKMQIQVILVFHLVNCLLSGALCSLALQSSALKLAGSIIREERPIPAVVQGNLQEKQTQRGAG